MKLSKPQLNRYSTQPQPNKPLAGLDLRMTLHTPPHHPTQTQYQQYFSSYWPDFDETLKVGSLGHLEQIPTVTGHLFRQHLS